MFKKIKTIIGELIISVTCLFALTGSMIPTTMERIRIQGEIVVVTLNSPTTYVEDNVGPTGYEYELAKAFADFLDVKLVLKQADSLTDLYQYIYLKKADFAAAGLTVSHQNHKPVRYSTPYMNVTQQVIYRRGTKKPRNIDDLANGTLAITPDSSRALQLRSIQSKDSPQLTWSESPDFDAVELLSKVSDKEFDLTIVTSNEFEVLQAYYPNLAIAFNLTGAQSLAWAFPQSRDNSLFQKAESFFHNSRSNGLLIGIKERYYGHLGQLDYVGAKLFKRQIDRKLSRYEKLFKQAGEKYDLDWRLLAAMSYQESHWNPMARSFTGVRGMMMLTQRTAAELRVSNRLDPKQSIYGGASYLIKLRKRLPKSITEPDRTWMALAAYNVGYGHLADARRLTTKDGADSTIWVNVQKYLPRLSQRRYYRQTRYGYARGREPVTYVQNIRRYFDVLAWYETPKIPETPKDTEDTNTAVDIALETDNIQPVSNVNVIPPLL